MADIKVKESKKGTVKTINKAVVGTEKMKDRLVQAKDKTKETYQEETSDSGTEYAINKISKTVSNFPKNIDSYNKYGKKNLNKTVENIQKSNQNLKKIKEKIRTTKKLKTATKNTKRTIKTVDKTVKTTKQTVKATEKATKKAMQIAKETAKATKEAIKVGVKATIATIKAIVAAIKALIEAIIAGGWVVVAIIIVICFICAFCLLLTNYSGNEIVAVATEQIGDVGGEKFWTWYGYSNRVEWCACFVSWCANQCGYIEKDIIPKFENCELGANWFKEKELWQDKNSLPKSGDIIFFDWENDGIPDHVGIVENVSEEKVHTIEGNNDDSCKRAEYSVDSSVIYGYGVPEYQKE